MTRLPGSTSPANTACCSVIPSVPVPKVPVDALSSMELARPIWVLGSAGLVRTEIPVVRKRSPSMTSSPERPVNVSLPIPPVRMSPSPQTGPVSGQAPEADRDVVSAAVPSHAETGGRIAASPVIRFSPAWSIASQPWKPVPPTSRGVESTPS